MYLGIVSALLSALLFGITVPVAKSLLGSLQPEAAAGLLYLGAGIGLAAMRAGQKTFGLAPSEASLRRADLPALGVSILFGGVLAPLSLMIGLARADAASASLLLNLEGLATMAIAWLVYREHSNRRLVMGAFAILLGAAVLSWKGSAAIDWGAIWIVAACLGWGIDNNVTRKLSAADPVQIAMLKGLVAGSVNLLLATRGTMSLPQGLGVATALLIGFLGYGLSLALYVRALRDLGTARTGAYFSLAPFIGAVLSLLWLRETLTPEIIFGGGLMAMGLWLHLTERHEHSHRHTAIGHAHLHTHDTHHQHKHASGEGSTEPHSHWHQHEPLFHRHAHYPDLHHRHDHESDGEEG